MVLSLWEGHHYYDSAGSTWVEAAEVSGGSSGSVQLQQHLWHDGSNAAPMNFLKIGLDTPTFT